MSGLGLNDTLPFGKYKGSLVHEVILKDANWCCWIRDEKKKAGQPKIWNAEVNTILNVAIDNDKRLAAKYSKWAGESDVAEVIKEATNRGLVIRDAQEKADEERRIAYENSWGAW